MSTATLATKSPFKSLLQLLQDAQDLYDIVAACYHTIMRFQYGHEPEFIIAIDALTNNSNNQYFKTLEKYRSDIERLIADVYNNIGFRTFLDGLRDSLLYLTLPSKVKVNKFVSFCAFYTIEVIDLYLECNPPNKTFDFSDHGPLNRNVCTKQCCVYFHESNSLLSSIYQLGKDGFRKPLHGFRLGSVFHKLLMFECTEFNSSIPKVVPVFMTNAFKQQLSAEHRLRIASIPFIGFHTFDFYHVENDEPCGDIPNGAFYVKYKKDQETINAQGIIQLLDLAVEKGANIIVFPEYVMSSGMLTAVCNHLSELQAYPTQQHNRLVLVLAGTNYEYDKKRSQGNNILHILNDSGIEIGKYYKFSPFLTQYKETVHGTTYGGSNQEISPDDVSVNDKDHGSNTTEANIQNGRRYLQNWEVLSDPGKECTIIDLEGIGRILPSVCRDAIDGDYTDTLAKLFMPSLLLISAWSTSVTSFHSRLSVLAETIHTTSLLCNCCNAVGDDKSTIGKLVYPTKQDSEMVAGKISLDRGQRCRNDCTHIGGCMHLIDLDFGKGELDVRLTHIHTNTNQ